MMSDSPGVVGEPTGPALKGYNVPGRNPDSRMPWELFLGSASHLRWTQEPGVLLYRWTRSQQRFESEKAAYEAGQWEELEAEELRQYGGWVEKAVEDMLNRREKLATFSGAMGLVIDFVGNAARVVLWGALLGQMDSGKGAQLPPAQGGGQIIPFPARPPPVEPPTQVPAAASMPLPR